MSNQTFVALFRDYDQAQSAIRELEANGIGSADISLVANNRDDRYGGVSTTHTADTADVGNAGDAGNAAGAGTGATLGTVLGGGAGLLAGIGALAIPGVGPVVAAGWLIATLTGAGVGAATGGIVGALVNSGVSSEHADVFAEGVRRGGVLVTVRASDADEDRVRDILHRHSPEDIDEHAQGWRSEGWNRFDANAGPYVEHPGASAAATASSGVMPGSTTRGVTPPAGLGMAPPVGLGAPVAAPIPGSATTMSGAAADHGVSAGTPPEDDRSSPWQIRRESESSSLDDLPRADRVRTYPSVGEPVVKKI